MLARHEVRAVIHFAALIQVGESVTDPSKYFRANFVNTLNLLDAMVGAGVREIVFSSSAAVYGDPIRVPIDEDHPLAPLSPYGDTKLMIEKVLARYERAYGIRSAALRYFNAAGRGSGRRAGRGAPDGEPSDPARDPGGAGPCPAAVGVRHRLPDAGRDCFARLHSRDRPGRRAHRGAATPGGRRRRASSRNVGTGPRLLRPRSDGDDRKGLRAARSAPACAAPGRRLPGAGRRREPHPHGLLGLAAPAPGSRGDRLPRLELGTTRPHGGD